MAEMVGGMCRILVVFLLVKKHHDHGKALDWYLRSDECGADGD